MSALALIETAKAPLVEQESVDEAQLLWTQHALYYRARCNRMARRGVYPAAMEGE